MSSSAYHRVTRTDLANLSDHYLAHEISAARADFWEGKAGAKSYLDECKAEQRRREQDGASR